MLSRPLTPPASTDLVRVLVDGQEPDRRTAALLALSAGTGVISGLVPVVQQQRAHTRATALAAADPTATAAARPSRATSWLPDDPLGALAEIVGSALG